MDFSQLVWPIQMPENKPNWEMPEDKCDTKGHVSGMDICGISLKFLIFLLLKSKRTTVNTFPCRAVSAPRKYKGLTISCDNLTARVWRKSGHGTPHPWHDDNNDDNDHDGMVTQISRCASRRVRLKNLNQHSPPPKLCLGEKRSQNEDSAFLNETFLCMTEISP